MPRQQYRIIIAFMVACGVCGCANVSRSPKPSSVLSLEGNSAQWHKRNDHLIPTEEEAHAILLLDQKRDFDSDDIDADGVKNTVDPSPYDWREVGYQPFGMLAFLSWNHAWNNYKYDHAGLTKAAQLLKEAGVSFVRMDFLWEDIQPQHDAFDFTKYDYIVDVLATHNIRILGIVGYSASWAGQQWNAPPHEFTDFTDFVSRVVARYKHRIKYWEIWNEPDSKTYWRHQDDMKTYTALLKVSYRAAKEADTTCKIVLGGMTNQGYYAIQNVYRNGGKDFFDILNIHPFINPLLEGELNRVFSLYRNIKRLQERYDDEEKKIWFTEIGCPGVTPDQKQKGWWEGKSPTEEKQAAFLEAVYTTLLPLSDVEKIFWAYFRDNKDHFKNDVDYFGVIRWDFSKKPAYGALQNNYIRWNQHHKEGL